MSDVQVLPTTELVGAYFGDGLSNNDAKSLKQDPHGFVYSSGGVTVSDAISFNVVENSDNTVHLVLPYYDTLEAAMAEAIPDKEIADVTGGEIIFGLLFGGFLGALAGAAAVGTTVAGAAWTIGGAVIGATAGAAVVATTVGGGVGGAQAAKKK